MFSKVTQLFYIFTWLPKYERAWLIRDLIAGVTVAAFTVPEAMAFASLAGLPPQHGLYASFAAPLAYFLFGSSRFISIGPTSAVSVTVGAGLAAVAINQGEVEAAVLLALLSALFFLLAWVFHLEFLANFISESVLAGFTTGAAFFIAATQLGAFTGLHSDTNQFFDSIAHLVQNLADISLLPVALGIAALLILLAGEHFIPRFPFPLLVVLIATAASWLVSLEALGVEIVGEIPQGLPGIVLPEFDFGQIRELLPIAMGRVFVDLLAGCRCGQVFRKKHNEHIDARRELLGLGAANVTRRFKPGLSGWREYVAFGGQRAKPGQVAHGRGFCRPADRGRYSLVDRFLPIPT
jgi:sulfate permease, SulP family